MCERYPGYLFGGTPVSSWDRSFNSLENQFQHQYRGRQSSTPRYWGSMSEGGGLSTGGGDNSKTNLIVNYLPQSMTEKDLYAMFMSIGQIESCRVMKDFKTGYSYGFGFVNFVREEDAARAIDTFNGYQLRNKRLKVSYARPSGDEIKDTNLYVTNLPRAITEAQLETIFGKYGRIVQKHILRDKSNGTPRGVAFVRFDKREEAQEAIAALNNVIPEGGTEPLCVKAASTCLFRGRSFSGHPGHAGHHPVHTGHHPGHVSPAPGYPALPAPATFPPAPPLTRQRSVSRHRLHSDTTVAEEHGKQKAAYYAGWAAGFHHNRGEMAWDCNSTMSEPFVPEPYVPPPLVSYPLPGPRNGIRPNSGGSARLNFPSYGPAKGPQRGNRGRNFPWAPTGYVNEERFKGQKLRNMPTPYW